MPMVSPDSLHLIGLRPDPQLRERPIETWWPCTRQRTECALHLVNQIGPLALAMLGFPASGRPTRIEGKQLWIQSCIDRRSFMPDTPTTGSSRTMAKTATGRTTAPAYRSDSASRGQLHGNGRRTSGRGMDSGRTCRIRQLGISNCVRDPEPKGSRAATGAARSHTELAVAVRQLPHSHEVQLELHRPVIAYLTPVVRRMRNIQIGTPEAQAQSRRNDMEDLEARVLRVRTAIESAIAGTTINALPLVENTGCTCRSGGYRLDERRRTNLTTDPYHTQSPAQETNARTGRAKSVRG